MKSIDLIRWLDGKTNWERLSIIIERLKELNVTFRQELYATGTNLIVDLGAGHRRIGVGSHFDRVQGSSGANDNCSAADHVSFRSAGLPDAFTVTCMSDLDVEVARQYFKALALGMDQHTLFQMLSRAPIFQHYHQAYRYLRPTERGCIGHDIISDMEYYFGYSAQIILNTPD